ncbi:glycine oxidase ThiO [Brevibacterium casei]|uniref:glycine oxidase ThiO n=1 Tax=Brevibacterium casei TaxID=33889 RepID=UPI0021AEB164|nr:glycine oxidase ThiO [Brevibacterium casei]MCT1447154.1 glycine oxidase ThiO [Brevibacterium casei]
MHVIVIGAGIIGLATAWELRGRGASVTLIDPAPGEGASYAAAGMIAPAAEIAWGQSPLFPLMRTSADLYPEFASRLTAETGHDLGETQTETLVCAGDRADLATLRDLRALQAEAGSEVELITGSRARDLEPALSPGVSGAVRIPGDHAVDPRRITGALLSLLDDDIVREEATGLVRVSGRTVGVALADGRSLTADQVVVAAGEAVGTIAGVPDLPLRAVHGDIIRLRTDASAPPLLTRTIRGLVAGRPVYIVPRPDGELVLGATSREDERPGVLAEGVHRLLHDAERLVPGILDAEITEITARARPGSPDDVPFIGRTDPGCVVSTGYFRHGILLTPLGARLGADLTRGEDSPWLPAGAPAALAPRRFSEAAQSNESPSPRLVAAMTTARKEP